MPSRSLPLQSSLVVTLAALGLPSLLATDPPRTGPLARDGLLLTMTLAEMMWLGLLLPFARRPDGSSERKGAAPLAPVAAGAVILALPMLILAGRLAGTSTAFLIGSQALAVAVAATAIPCAGRGGVRAGAVYIGAAVLVLFLPPFVHLAAGDLLGRAPPGIIDSLSPLTALGGAYPHRAPSGAVGVFAAGAAAAWIIRSGRLRTAATAAAGAVLVAAMVGSGPAPADRIAPDLVEVTSPLGGRFRAGGWAAATATFRNRSGEPLDGEVIIKVGGVEYPRSIRVPDGETASLDYTFLLPDERPAFRASYEGGTAPVPLGAVEEALMHLFRPVPPSRPLIGWVGDVPPRARRILEGISAEQVTLSDSIRPSPEALDAIDLLLVSGRVGGRLTRAMRDWQLHGGVLLSLSEEASVDLGAPLPEGGERIALRGRGKGTLGTLDIGGAGDRGPLFQRARDLLESGGRRDGVPSGFAHGLFGPPERSAWTRRRAAGWLVGLAALGVASSGLLVRRRRLGAQTGVAAAALVALPWIVPSSVVAEHYPILSGYTGSAALARNDVIRIAALGPPETIRLPARGGALPYPLGGREGLSLSGDGTWTVPISPGEERIFLIRGGEMLPGTVDVRGGPEGRVKVTNRTDLRLEEARLVRGGRRYPAGVMAPGETLELGVRGPGLPIPGDLRALVEDRSGPILVARTSRPGLFPEVPGACQGDPHRPLLLLGAEIE